MWPGGRSPQEGTPASAASHIGKRVLGRCVGLTKSHLANSFYSKMRQQSRKTGCFLWLVKYGHRTRFPGRNGRNRREHVVTTAPPTPPPPPPPSRAQEGRCAGWRLGVGSPLAQCPGAGSPPVWSVHRRVVHAPGSMELGSTEVTAYCPHSAAAHHRPSACHHRVWQTLCLPGDEEQQGTVASAGGESLWAGRQE